MLLLAASAFGQVPPAGPARATFDLNAKLINVPDTSWVVYGPDQASVRSEKGGPHGYPAIRVNVTRAGNNAWDDGAVSVMPKPVAAGDVILVAMHLLAPTLADGQSLDLPLIGATDATAPYPGGAPHVIEPGPVRVYDLGQGFDIKRLPHN